LIVVFVDEEYGEEDALATVVSGLVLGCCQWSGVGLSVVPDHHPIVVVQSGVARTLPARKQERAKQFIGGMDYRDVPSDYRAHEYLDRLKASSSAREGCRHYVDGARHTDLPESCWIIDPNVHHFVDVHIAIDEIPDRVSVVMVRNVGKMDPRDDQQQLLDELTERCSAIMNTVLWV
jgi:hypothetical protein